MYSEHTLNTCAHVTNNMHMYACIFNTCMYTHSIHVVHIKHVHIYSRCMHSIHVHMQVAWWDHITCSVPSKGHALRWRTTSHPQSKEADHEATKVRQHVGCIRHDGQAVGKVTTCACVRVCVSKRERAYQRSEWESTKGQNVSVPKVRM